MKKLNVAIIGQGRSGKDIHGAYLVSEANTLFTVKYVVEADASRRAIAEKMYEGCKTFADYTELFACGDIDLVVNASYSDMHYPITKDLLAHGKNVLCEKPFARNRFECDTLIQLAKQNHCFLDCFQQTFLAPFYQKAVEEIRSGRLGDIWSVNLRYCGFARRWDWQTLQKRMGGSVYNTGPHPIGLALAFLDFSPEAQVVFSRLGTVLTSGDADDCAKIVLTAPGKPIVDVEITATDAFSPYTLKIQGSRGTYQSTTGAYQMKYIIPEELTPRPLMEESLRDENNNPLYCSEQLPFHEESGELNGSAFTSAVAQFYENMYRAITKGDAMAVTPEMAARVIGVIEAVHAANPLPLKY